MQRAQFYSTPVEQFIQDQEITQWGCKAKPARRIRRAAPATKGAGALLWVIPSKAIDTNLFTSHIASNVATRLGVDFMESGHRCCKCGVHPDAQGAHALSCMAGVVAPEVPRASITQSVMRFKITQRAQACIEGGARWLDQK